MESEPLPRVWIRAKLRRLAWLCYDAPLRLRWTWLKQEKNGRARLCLVSPRGVIWEFKLSGGAWLSKIS